MKKNKLLIAVLAAALAAALAGCASKGPQPTAYDFGPMGAPLPPASMAPGGNGGSNGIGGTGGIGGPAAAFPAIVVSDVGGPASLDTQRMFYRLMYADARQSRPAQRRTRRTIVTIELIGTRPVLHAWQGVADGHAAHAGFPLERGDERALRRGELLTHAIGRARIRGSRGVIRQAELHREVLRRPDARRAIRLLQIHGMTGDGERHADRRDGDGDVRHHERAGQPTDAPNQGG